MSVKSQIAKSIGKFSLWSLKKFTNGGSSLPGKIAQTIDPNILSTLAKNYEVAIITGTNGKTLTTSLATKAIREKYPNVITNESGSNMVQGIISTFLQAPTLKGEKGIAILEVDEGSLKNVVKHLKPKVFVHTNIFEDQLDRYGSVEAIYEKLVHAAIEMPHATIISNADCPILTSQDMPNPKIYFGFEKATNENEVSENKYPCPNCGNLLKYHWHTYGELGDYYCENCFFKRPPLNHQVSDIQSMDMATTEFIIDEEIFTIPVSGVYNVYNALAAYSLAKFFDVSSESIRQGFMKAERVLGRQELIEYQGHQITLNLVKNPVGFNQVVDVVQLDTEEFALITAFNNNFADGTDISWINDANFESFKAMPISNIYVSGSQATALRQRFIEAGIQEERIILIENIADIPKVISEENKLHIHLLASYTATLELRKLIVQP